MDHVDSWVMALESGLNRDGVSGGMNSLVSSSFLFPLGADFLDLGCNSRCFSHCLSLVQWFDSGSDHGGGFMVLCSIEWMWVETNAGARVWDNWELGRFLLGLRV